MDNSKQIDLGANTPLSIPNGEWALMGGPVFQMLLARGWQPAGGLQGEHGKMFGTWVYMVDPRALKGMMPRAES